MQQTRTLTIELTPFQMEIINRAASCRRISPQELVLSRINIEEVEAMISYVLDNAFQGRAGELVHKRCERCAAPVWVGADAELCGYCEHFHPERCVDEVHARIANDRDDAPDEGFHCETCNAWIVPSLLDTTVDGLDDIDIDFSDIFAEPDTLGGNN